MRRIKLLEEFLAGTYTDEYQYKAFLPNYINESWQWQDSEINILLEEANRKLGEINAFSFLIPNIDLFIKMHITKEANTSSKIEGTKTEMDEAIMKEEEISPERRDDWKEVHQYIEAMNSAIELLKQLPLSNRLIRETHKILLKTVRGENKIPGEFRTSQNWIGGSNLATAKFIPPHHKYIDELMGDLEKFIHNETITIDDNFLVEKIINDNIVNIVGWAGQGKSTVLCKMFINQIHKGSMIPIFLSFRNINHSILIELHRLFKDSNIECSEGDIVALLRSKKILLILDAFDEIRSDDLKFTLTNEIKRMQQNYGLAIICSSRPGTYLCDQVGIENYNLQEIQDRKSVV